MHRRFFLSFLVFLAVTADVSPLSADEGRGGRDREHREDVRGAVERGDIRSLEQVLDLVRPQIDGEIVGVELEQEDGLWVYELRVADRRGRLLEVYVDAATARIVKTEVK